MTVTLTEAPSISREIQVAAAPQPRHDLVLLAESKHPVALARAFAVASGNSEAISADADSRRRDIGLWLAAGLTLLFFGSGVAVSLTSAPAPLAVACFGFTTTSLGATFAIITDKLKSAEKARSVNSKKEQT